MILAMSRLALSADNRACDPYRRDRASEVEVSESDRKHFADPNGGAEKHFDDLPELSVWFWASHDLSLFPLAHGLAD